MVGTSIVSSLLICLHKHDPEVRQRLMSYLCSGGNCRFSVVEKLGDSSKRYRGQKKCAENLDGVGDPR